jgi:hypothetical protein
MRDKFPHKKPGDSLEADHVNRLSDVARRVGNFQPGSNLFGQHNDSTLSGSVESPWEQHTLEITSNTIDDDDASDSGMFLGRVRWYDSTEEIWKTDNDDYEIDASDLDMTIAVGMRLTCWWNDQRSMYIPVRTDRMSNPLIDLSAELSEQVERTTTAGSEIRFALEISGSGTGGWRTVNAREFSSNNISREAPENAIIKTGGSLTGCGFYTFSASGTVWVRASCQTDIVYDRINVDAAALRIEGKGEGNRSHSEGPTMSPGTVVTNWSVEAEVNNASLAVGYPTFTNEGDGRIRIEVPTGPAWTFEAELSLGFDFEDESSQSTSSTSSESSSISTSSVSSESSSQSSSLSTSSSASSQSSTSSSESSSAGLSHVKVVVDVCCDGPDLVIVTQDILFDAAGHYVGVTERDPPNACSEAP